MADYKFNKIATFDAVGGPSAKGKDPNGNSFGPTHQGRHVVYQIGKHISPTYPFWSGIKFGTPLRVYNNKAQLEINGHWIDISSYSPNYNKYKSPDEEKKLLKIIEDEYSQYKARLERQHPGTLSTAEKIKQYPDSWIFNDFGHVTIKYFKDKNGDYILNKGEEKSSEYIHTTPFDEYATSQGADFDLTPSHGCTHLRPNDITTFINQGYVKIGSVIEVKSYTATVALQEFESPVGRPDYELHFYPGLKKIYVYEVHEIKHTH